MIAVLVAISSCNKQDKEDPTVQILGIENDSGDPSTSFEAGESIVIHIQMDDNELLNQLRVSVNGVSEVNEGMSYSSETGAFGDWNGVNVSLLEGSNSNKRVNITLSDTIQGWWEVLATVVDDVGRLSEEASAYFEISNQNAPQFEINRLSPGLIEGEWIVEAGQELKITGSISDDSGLESTVLRMLNESGSDLSSRTILHNGLISYNLNDLTYTIPTGYTGALYLEFESIDQVGFGSVYRLEMKVEE